MNKVFMFYSEEEKRAKTNGRRPMFYLRRFLKQK